MSIKEGTTRIPFRIWDKFATDFDVLQNISIQNRKSDIWFSEFNQMSIKMRPWTTQVWNTLTWTWWVFSQIFFIDFFKKVHHIKWYNNKVWRLDTATNTWIDLWIAFIGNNFTFTPMLLPMMLNWTVPVTYTVAGASTWAERVKKSATDTWWAANIWKYLIITQNTANTEAYRGAYASILDYDIATFEYTLNWAGITTILKAWATYQIYDTLWEYLQVANWVEFEQYFFWITNWTIINNATFTWLSTKWLRNVRWLQNTEFILKQISFDNSYWTFNKNTLYYTAWSLNNPFFYNFTTALSIPWSVSWYINDLFVFKNNLVIGWSNYAAYLKWPVTWLTSIKMITQSYWITPRTLADVWIDWYYLSTNKHIYSLRENLSWTALIATDEWKIIWNYLKDYNFISWAWWIITVLDIQYKFWSVYTWLAPSSIVFNEGIVYMSDNNSDKVRKFDETVTNDVWVNIIQKVALKEISWGIPFNIKSLTDVYLWLDNFPQDLTVSLYMANAWKNTKKNTKSITLSQADVNPAANPMWQWVMWEGIVWWTAVDPNITLPIMKKIAYDVDDALLWKIILIWANWSPFYLNQLDVEIVLWEDKTYFDPSNTI